MACAQGTHGRKSGGGIALNFHVNFAEPKQHVLERGFYLGNGFVGSRILSGKM